jgi:hypothetical protein
MKTAYFPFWVFSFALFPMGLGAIYFGAYDVVAARRIAHASAINGKVLSSTLAPRLLGPAQPDIRYVYEIDGHPYVSDRLWPGNFINIVPFLTTAASRQMVAKFPEGTSVSVYVDPSAPTLPALISDSTRAERWLGVLIFFLVIGMVSPFALDRWGRSKKI